MSPRSQAWFGALGLLVGTLGIVARLVPVEGIAPFSSPMFAGIAGTVVSMLLAGAMRGAAGPARGPVPSAADLACGAWSMGPLAALPFVSSPLATVALVLLAAAIASVTRHADAFLVPRARGGQGERDLFVAGVWLMVGAIAVHYVGVATAMVGGHQSDGAYYFGVARWIARTGRLEEPVVWHFLAPPAEIVHTAFDYWQGLTSLVLVLPFRLFGATRLVAGLTMSAISIGTLVLFAYLVLRTNPPRTRPLQLAIVLAFAFSPAMIDYRFDTESPVLVQLALLASLVAFSRRRFVAASVLVFGALFARTDALTTVLVVWGACLASTGGRARGRVAAVTGGLVVTYVLTNLARFGTPTPPGARLGPGLREGYEIYLWRPERVPVGLLELLEMRAGVGTLIGAPWSVWNIYGVVRYLLVPEVLLVGLVLGIVACLVRRHGPRVGTKRLALAIVVLASTATVAIAPGLFYVGRTLHGLIPAMALVVLWGADLVPHATRHATRDRPRLSSAAFGLTASLALLPIVLWATPYEAVPPPRQALEEDLASVEPILDGAPVATTCPWWVIANTTSPAVLLPPENEASMVAVLSRYRPRYVLIGRVNEDSWTEAVWGRWSRLRDEGGRIGPYVLVDRVDRSTFVMYRVALAQ